MEDVNFSQFKKNLEKELYVHFLLIGSKTPQTYEYNWICLFLSTFVLILMWKWWQDNAIYKWLCQRYSVCSSLDFLLEIGVK